MNILEVKDLYVWTFLFRVPTAFISAISPCSFAIKERSISTVMSAANTIVRTTTKDFTASRVPATPTRSATASAQVFIFL